MILFCCFHPAFLPAGDTMQRLITHNHRLYHTFLKKLPHKGIFPLLCQDEHRKPNLHSHSKKPDIWPCWKCNSFFFPSYSELHNRGDIVRSCHRNEERKQKLLQRRQMPPRAQEVVKPCPLSCWAGLSDLSPQKIQATSRNVKQTSENPWHARSEFASSAKRSTLQIIPDPAALN